MGFYIDLEKISIDQYKELLTTRYLSPSRTLLRDDIDRIFKIIKTQGIGHVEALFNALKSKKKLQDFSLKTGITEDYLTILIREIKSNKQSPVKIKDFPGISEDIVSKLEKLGIKTTLHLFDKVLTPESRKALATEAGIDETQLLKLTKLSDLTRIRWVNHTFAFMLYEVGYDTIDKVVDADYEAMHTAIAKINNEYSFYKGTIGVNDIKLCIEVAADITHDINY